MTTSPKRQTKRSHNDKLGSTDSQMRQARQPRAMSSDGSDRLINVYEEPKPPDRVINHIRAAAQGERF